MTKGENANSVLGVSILNERDGWWLFSLQLYRTLEAVSYRRTTVPAGYVTNFGSIPFGFRWLIPPLTHQTCHCYVVHDYLCDTAETWQDRKYADKTLASHVREKGYTWRVPLIYAGVRIGAVLWWLRNRK